MAEALCCERPGKVSGEWAASLQVEAPGIEEVTKRSRSLTPSSRVRVLEKWPEHVVQLHWRPKHFGDASVNGWLPRTVVSVEWSQPEPRGQTTSRVDGRAREAPLLRP